MTACNTRSGLRTTHLGPRYVLTELAGYASDAPNTHPGISCHVLDTYTNHMLVATFRSEEQPRRHPIGVKWATTRQRAIDAAARPNMEVGCAADV